MKKLTYQINVNSNKADVAILMPDKIIFKPKILVG